MKKYSLKFLIRTTSTDKRKQVKVKARLTVGRNIDLIADTGYFVMLGEWNPKKERPEPNRNSTLADIVNINHVNEQLGKLKNFLDKRIVAELQIGEINSDWLLTSIEMFLNPEKFETKSITLFSFIEDFISKAETRINPKTGKAVSYKMYREYENTFRYLKQFAKYIGKEPDFADIDLQFYDDFMAFLQGAECSLKKKDKATGKKIKLKLATNTVGKKVQTLKIFLNDATERGINSNLKFKSHKFTTVSEESDSFHLDTKELDQLYRHDFSEDKRLEKVRDLFLIGCWTGLRFSDLSHLAPENLKENFFYVTQQKTGGKVVIPVHPVVSEIMAKYGGKLPPSISNQKFNQYLQEAAQIAGVNAITEKGITRAGKRDVKKFHKYELLTTHTARRSFATNMYEMGIPAYSIMAITGHKTETAFLKYLKTTPETHAKMMLERWLDSMKQLNKTE